MRTHLVRRFVVSYLLLLLIPVIMGVLFYSSTVASKYDDIRERNLEGLRLSGETLELVLQEVRRISTHLTTNQHLNDLGRRSDIFGTPQISDLVDYVVNNNLIPFSMTNPYILQYFVAYRPSRAVFMPRLAATHRSFYSYLLSFEGLDDQQWWDRYVTRYHDDFFAPSQEVNAAGARIRVVPYLNSIGFSGDFHGLIVILLDEQKLLQLFDEIDISDGGAIMISATDGRVLAGHTVGNRDMDWYHSLAGLAGVNQTTRLKDHFVVKTKLESGWILTTVQSNDYLRRKASYVRNITLMVIGFFVVVGVIVAVVLAYQSSKPLLSVMEDLAERLPEAAESRGDVYGDLRASISGLLGRAADLQHQMEQQRPLMQRLFLDDLLGGLLYDNENVSALARRVGVRLDGSFHTVLLARLTPPEGSLTPDDLDDLELRKLVLKGLVSERWPSLVFHDSDTTTAALIASLESSSTASFSQEMEIIVEDLWAHVFSRVGVPVAVAVGRSYAPVRNLYRSYRQARAALNYQAGGQNGAVVWYDRVFGDAPSVLWYPPSIEERLMMFVRGGYGDDLESLLDEIRRKNFQERTTSFSQRSILVNMLKGSLVKAYAETSIGDATLERQIEEATQPVAGDLLTEYDAVAEMIRTLCRATADARRGQSGQLRDRVAEYLEQRSSDPELSLASMATDLTLSPQYLSRFCKERLGENFHVLMERRRMELIREQMQDSRRRLRDIVLECGYSSMNTFSKAFKRRYGISPTEYRRRLALTDR